MRFELKLSGRYLWSNKLQSSLLIFGVAVGVWVFTFIAALINGLGVRLTDDVAGNIAHVTLEAKDRRPATFMGAGRGRALVAIQPGNDLAAGVRTSRPILALSRVIPEVRAVVPEVTGNASLVRGQKDVSVMITGISARDASSIVRLDRALVRGKVEPGARDLIVGALLAKDLGVDVGDRVVMRPARAERPSSEPTEDLTMTIRGIFRVGSQAVDSRTAFMDLGVARKAFGIADGVTQIELKLNDPWIAPAVAARLGRATHLKVTHWLERNARLQDGLRSQQSTGTMIKLFSLLTIVIGVASALLLSVVRRRAEIGILRSFGIQRSSIMLSFLFQGLLIGGLGAALGAGIGYGFSRLLAALTMQANGLPSIPIDPAQGEYVRAMVLAVIATGVAALLPARSAANVDPLQAIQS